MTARHPLDALYTLRLKEGAFELVISDVHMPDMDGFELQKAIEQEFNLPVVCELFYKQNYMFMLFLKILLHEIVKGQGNATL